MVATCVVAVDGVVVVAGGGAGSGASSLAACLPALTVVEVVVGVVAVDGVVVVIGVMVVAGVVVVVLGVVFVTGKDVHTIIWMSPCGWCVQTAWKVSGMECSPLSAVA